MKTVMFTKFRSHASGLFSEVEKGETLLVLRHGRPVAEVTPVDRERKETPSWKRPGLKLAVRGAGLSSVIIKERKRAGVL